MKFITLTSRVTESRIRVNIAHILCFYWNEDENRTVVQMTDGDLFIAEDPQEIDKLVIRSGIGVVY